jgi:hypothetical protein
MGYTSLSSSIPLIGHWGPPPRTTSWLPSGRRGAGLGEGDQIEGVRLPRALRTHGHEARVIKDRSHPPTSWEPSRSGASIVVLRHGSCCEIPVDLAKCQGPALVSNLLLIHTAEATSG